MIVGELGAMAFELLATGNDKEIFAGEFLEIDEAICWVAFDNYQFPPLGPRVAHELLIHADLALWLDEEADRQEQAFGIAREQVFNAIENGHVVLVGKESERTDVVNDVRYSQPFVTVVTPQMVAEGGWKEQSRSYDVGELKFDGLFVRFTDMVKLFGPLKKSSSKASVLAASLKPDLDDQTQDDPQVRRKGRRPKYDWENILATVSLSIGQSRKFPENQAALERMIAEHCMSALGNEPSASLIRMKASNLFDTLRQNRQ